MDVDRICPVVKISRGAILSEKVGSVEFESVANARFEFRRARIAANVLQRAKVISGVEVINPSLRSPLPVIPGTITVLLGCREAGHLECWTQKFLLAGVLMDTTKQGRSKEIRVVGLGPK